MPDEEGRDAEEDSNLDEEQRARKNREVGRQTGANDHSAAIVSNRSRKYYSLSYFCFIHILIY